MKKFIQHRIRTLLNEADIDGENMNPALESLCNTMSVSTYQEVLGRIISAIGPQERNPQLWAKIAEPLRMLSQANFEINKEKYTTMDGTQTNKPVGMTGDSMVDEANTWWTAIQSTLCEQGSVYQY